MADDHPGEGERTESEDTPAGEPAPVELPGVALTVSTPGGEREITGLSLSLSAVGISVQKADGETAAHLPWTEVKTLQIDALSRQHMARLTASSSEGSHRFLVPGTADQLRRLAETWFPEVQASRPASSVSPWLITLLILVVAAGAVVAILAGLGKL